MNGIVGAVVVKVVSDPEMRFTPAGKPVLSFSGLVFDAKAGPDAAAEWLRISCWDDLANAMENALRKGGEAYCEGRVKLASYKTADGTERHGLNMSAWTCQPFGMIGKKAPKRKPVDEYREAFAVRPTIPAGSSTSTPPWE